MTGNAAVCNSYMYLITALSRAAAEEWFREFSGAVNVTAASRDFESSVLQ
ncbi:hypothetical protein H5410_053650 [Solanum commersonii]|uniref:Uncharacterized protein n=1 Tax=Solanum commersonii TaxID=4109 RepID=A0A9J5X5G9_SOLCO|nr:hypothetical protein H5410_053650 [Solanum commersonii]